MNRLMAFDAYFFDMDGTIFLGDSLLPYVNDVITLLRKNGKKIMFLTNNSVQTRADLVKRLNKLGLEVEVNEIVTASYAAGLYFQDYGRDAKVLIIGEEAIHQEFDIFGINRTENPFHATHVLVGLDRKFTYEKLHVAMKAVRHGAVLVATNPDPYCPVFNDDVPDTGALIKAIETASSVKGYVNVGKPSTFYAQQVIEMIGIPAERCLMIGDRLETDILLGINSCIKTALVLTGVTTKGQLDRESIKPDFVLSTLAKLCVGHPISMQQG